MYITYWRIDKLCKTCAITLIVDSFIPRFNYGVHVHNSYDPNIHCNISHHYQISFFVNEGYEYLCLCR